MNLEKLQKAEKTKEALAFDIEEYINDEYMQENLTEITHHPIFQQHLDKLLKKATIQETPFLFFTVSGTTVINSPGRLVTRDTDGPTYISDMANRGVPILTELKISSRDSSSGVSTERDLATGETGLLYSPNNVKKFILTVFDKIKKKIGGGELSEQQKKQLTRNLIDHVLIHELIHTCSFLSTGIVSRSDSSEKDELGENLFYQTGAYFGYQEEQINPNFEKTRKQTYRNLNEAITETIAQELYWEFKKSTEGIKEMGDLRDLNLFYESEIRLVREMITLLAKGGEELNQDEIEDGDSFFHMDESETLVWNGLKHGYFRDPITALETIIKELEKTDRGQGNFINALEIVAL